MKFEEWWVSSGVENTTCYETAAARKAFDAATKIERKEAELRCAKTSVLIDGHHGYTAMKVQAMMMAAVSMRSNAAWPEACRQK